MRNLNTNINSNKIKQIKGFNLILPVPLVNLANIKIKITIVVSYNILKNNTNNQI